MTGPSMPTNEEIVAKAHEQVLEGQESEAVAQQVVDFVASQKATFDAALATAQQTIDALTATSLPEAQRTEISDALTTAKSAFDNTQRVLTAIVTPPAEPLPMSSPRSARRR